MIVDRIIDNIGQLCTIPGQVQRGSTLGELGIIENAAIAILGDQIAMVGTSAEIRAECRADTTIDAGGRLVTPGLVDPHTHLIFAGDRADEFEMRLQGKTYLEIMEAGGGIVSTVKKTRAASVLQLVDSARARLDRMMQHGTTTVEAKTGYGLSAESELDMLNAIALLDAEHPVDLVPTFLAAHAIPLEYAHDPDAYVSLIVDRMLISVAKWRAKMWSKPIFCDAFCERGAFTLAQTRRILDQAQFVGLPVRLHADEFESLGGVGYAVDIGARSVDHLLVTTPDDVARLGASNTVAILIPPTPFGLGIPNTAPARDLIAADAILALGTDCNPGTAWNESMQLVMALATRQLGLTPAQALAASTINAAYSLDMADQVGSIEIGKLADMVIWDVPDYRHLSYRFGANMAHTVFKRGNVVATSM
jgi:imidazolonepropionase